MKKIIYVSQKNKLNNDTFNSINAALSYIKENIDSFDEIEIKLDDGVYYVSEPIIFSKWTKNKPITISSINKGKAIISGGKIVRDFKTDDGRIYYSILDEENVRNIFVNGERRILSREPNGENYHNISGWVDDYHTRVRVKKEFLKGATSFEAIFYLEWSQCVLRIKDVIDEGDTVILVPEENEDLYLHRHKFHPVQIRNDMLVRFQNAKEFLDEPGEFYFDKAEKKLYYIPLPYEDMTNFEVAIPKSESVIKVCGTKTKPIKNISIKDITIEYSNFKDICNKGFMEIQAGHYAVDYDHTNYPLFNIPNGALHVEYGKNIIVDGVTVRHSTGTGINYCIGVSNSKIINSNIFDSSAASVCVGPYVSSKADGNFILLPEDLRITVHHIDVINNYIGTSGVEFYRSPSLLNVLGHHINMIHNEIAFGNYTGISNGWGWSLKDFIVSHNIISNNDIHHIGMKGSDLGGIYNLNNQKGTKIINNYIHEINKGKNGFSIGSPAEGLYLDEGTNNLVVKGNQIAYAGEIGRLIYYNVAGNDNKVFNNKGLMCGDTLNKKIINESGIKERIDLPYNSNDINGLSLGVRIGSYVNKTGLFGIRFKAKEDIVVYGFGRFNLPGNTKGHKITLYDDLLNPLISASTKDNDVPHKNGFKYGYFDNKESFTLRKNEIYYLLSEEDGFGDSFSSYDTLQYFDKRIMFLCGVDIKGNIRKETNAYLGLDMICD